MILVPSSSAAKLSFADSNVQGHQGRRRSPKFAGRELHDKNISGTLPTEIGNLTKLKSVYVPVS